MADVGRPSVMDESTLGILERAFMDGMTVTQAVHKAQIDPSTYYDWMKKDESFSKRMNRAQDYLDSVAKENVGAAVKNKDLDTSKWWLERKLKKEFSLRSELTGADGEPVVVSVPSILIDKNAISPDTKPSSGEQS